MQRLAVGAHPVTSTAAGRAGTRRRPRRASSRAQTRRSPVRTRPRPARHPPDPGTLCVRLQCSGAAAGAGARAALLRRAGAGCWSHASRAGLSAACEPSWRGARRRPAAREPRGGLHRRAAGRPGVTRHCRAVPHAHRARRVPAVAAARQRRPAPHAARAPAGPGAGTRVCNVLQWGICQEPRRSRGRAMQSGSNLLSERPGPDITIRQAMAARSGAVAHDCRQHTANAALK